MWPRRRRFGSVRGVTWIDCITWIGMSRSTRKLFLPSLSFVISACTSTSMKQHVNRIAATCFFHLRRLWQIRRRIGRDLTARLILAFITTRLDYCNSVLAVLPQITLAPLQRVQNAAARLVFELHGCEHVTPSLIQLHWLPVRWNNLLQ